MEGGGVEETKTWNKQRCTKQIVFKDIKEEKKRHTCREETRRVNGKEI